MVDKNSTHIRKFGGVRFSADATESSDNREENVHKTAELEWEKCCETECSFGLYFGILKLSHIYTMTMDIVFHQTPVKLETILDEQSKHGLQLLVTQFAQSQMGNRITLQIDVIISSDTTPGPFHRTFLLKDVSKLQQMPVTVNVTGKILRQGQGTATLRDGVHVKSILAQEKDDEE